jgi:hypothetical protein
MKVFLYEYPFNGALYCAHVLAGSRTEAEARLFAMQWGKVKGEQIGGSDLGAPQLGWLALGISIGIVMRGLF